MTQNLKAGDLALVISGGFSGQVVELVRFVEPGEMVVSPAGKMYEFRPAAGIGGWLCNCGLEKVVKHEKNLMPLRGSGVQTLKLDRGEICYLFKVPA